MIEEKLEEAIFALVADTSKFRAILNRHISNKGQVLIRNLEGDQYLAQAFSLSRKNELECAPPLSETGGFLPRFIGKKLLVDFFYDEERFHFETQANVVQVDPAPAIFTLPIPDEVFQRQRRTQFRYTIPENFRAEFTLVGADGKQYNGKLKDISNLGCAVEWQPELPDLKIHGLINGQLILDKDHPIDVRGIVCFLIAKSGILRVGIEFNDLDSKAMVSISDRIIKLQKFVFEMAQISG